jgi:MAF protein
LSRLTLASASPRRRELLSRLDIEFDVRPVGIDESPGRSKNPEAIARRLARSKAEAARLVDEESPILAADTIVWFENDSLGKPNDADEAREMLGRMRGKEHIVISAVAFMPARKRSALIRHPLTRVRMREYSDEDIEASIAAGTPFDKAGGYAIQDREFGAVSAYRGCYCNVIGLSLYATMEVLRKGGMKVGPAALLPECRECPLIPPFAAPTNLGAIGI